MTTTPWPFNNNRNTDATVQGVPYAKGSDTSRQAAESMEEIAPTIRQRVYNFVLNQGEFGTTDDEIEIALGLTHQTASARRRKLVQIGAVYKTEQRRKTRSGRNATVWRAIPDVDVTAPQGRPPKPPADALCHRVTVYMTEEQNNKLKTIARQSGETVGTTARRLMGFGLYKL